MTRQKSDEQRKQQIRAAATRCFVRRGYAATRLLDIAREAGLSKGGVYFHYRAKEQLFHDILDAQIEALKERWGFEPVADQPADRTLAQVVSAHIRELEARPDETRLCNLLVTMAVQEPEFRGKLEQAFTVTRQLYSGLIARGISDGVFADGDPEVLAQGIVALVQGLAAVSAVNADGKLPVSAENGARVALRMVGANPDVAASVVHAPDPVTSEAADESSDAPALESAPESLVSATVSVEAPAPVAADAPSAESADPA
ncbi:MAG: TetR/AcrR family transcriptional regulator [Myxococcales bacterium]|nr:TetR/AcrR family transcriptional regulator [Myxococcales bacterium]MCB9752769.1 TetR/AcrR family transcriptional regulator [Myxococcales bacterium]